MVSGMSGAGNFPWILYNTIQYKFYCQLPMGAFHRQILIVQVIKKQTNNQTKNTQELSINNFPENRPPKYLSPCLQGGRVTLMLGLP